MQAVCISLVADSISLGLSGELAGRDAWLTLVVVCVRYIYTAIATSAAAQRARSQVRARRPIRTIVVAALIASPALAIGLG